MLKLEDPTDNSGRGWARLTARQLVDLLYIGLKLAPRRHRAGLVDRNAGKSDEAAKAVATHLAERLEQYPIFGPARPAQGPTCGQQGTGPAKSQLRPTSASPDAPLLQLFRSFDSDDDSFA